jgi:hypothetical protein
MELLLNGIKEKLFTLPETTEVYPDTVEQLLLEMKRNLTLLSDEFPEKIFHQTQQSGSITSVYTAFSFYNTFPY